MAEQIVEESPEVYEGWYWAWQHHQHSESILGPWCIIFIRGVAPFLTLHLAVYGAHDNGWNFGEHLNLSRSMLNPKEWQIGPRIEFPVEEEETECQPT